MACECVSKTGVTQCAHALRYYRPKTVDERPIFWKFDAKDMPRPEQIKKKVTKSKDRCHVNVYGIPDDALRDFFIYSNPTAETYRELAEFTICASDGMRPLRLADMKQDHTENNA